MPQPLPRTFFARDAVALAEDLVGMHLAIRQPGGVAIGRIVETEAYQGPDDLAAHSVGGRRTARTEVMYGPAGHAYVYLIYGIWNCLNVVAAKPGIPHAVLLRAVEPVSALTGPSWGPGLLCRAFDIDRSHNGLDLRGKQLWIEAPKTTRTGRVCTGPRIGVDYAGEWAQRPWRFFDPDSPFVSTVSAAARRRALERRKPDQIQV
ncbi:MAG TPA: DNA-3-methyladenine glycosylase [Steroidobacteraceae bacterium]|jgi:DNA-3-methyladenine glycosylase|nr:DNA-3-methyladenine glycosylase [Steroidobacteraceae bacterium]